MHNQGFHIFMDRYYTSCNLFKKLRNFGIRATGSIMQNRKGLPDLSTEKTFKKNESLSFFREGLHYCVRKDAKNTHFLSNFYNDKKIYSERMDKYGNLNKIEIPLLIYDYNKNMRGVDISDQNIHYYIMDHREYI